MKTEKRAAEGENRILYNFLGLILLVLVWSLISGKSNKIESLENKLQIKNFELYEYKKHIIMQNKKVITNYVRAKFPAIKEYRLLSTISKEDFVSLVLIIGAPIKTKENKIGYTKDNYYNLNVNITPQQFLILDLKKKVYYEKAAEVIGDNLWVDLQYHIGKFITYIMPNGIKDAFSEWGKPFNSISSFLIDSERDSIENPTFLVEFN